MKIMILKFCLFVPIVISGTLIDNADTLEQIMSQPDDGDMAGYFTKDEVDDFLEAITISYPSLISTHIIGKTVEGEDITAVRISGININQEQKQDIPAILITGLHHAREPMSLSMNIYTILKLVYDYIQDKQEVVGLLRNAVIYSVPIVNVDTYMLINQKFEETGKLLMYRKNRRVDPNKSCKDVDTGVDLNRNYDFNFASGVSTDASSGNPCYEDYRGPSAFSEPETQALKNFIESHNIKIAINYHAYGNLYITPFNCFKDKNNSLLEEDPLNQIYQEFYESGFLPDNVLFGPSYKGLGYLADGEATDWLFGVHQIIAFSIELGIHNKKGEDFQFYPPKSQIKPVVLTHIPPLMYLMRKLLSELKISKLSEGIVSCTSSKNPYEIQQYCKSSNYNSSSIQIYSIYTISNLGFKNLTQEKAKFTISMNDDAFSNFEFLMLFTPSAKYSSTDLKKQMEHLIEVQFPPLESRETKNVTFIFSKKDENALFSETLDFDLVYREYPQIENEYEHTNSMISPDLISKFGTIQPPHSHYILLMALCILGAFGLFGLIYLIKKCRSQSLEENIKLALPEVESSDPYTEEMEISDLKLRV